MLRAKGADPNLPMWLGSRSLLRTVTVHTPRGIGPESAGGGATFDEIVALRFAAGSVDSA